MPRPSLRPSPSARSSASGRKGSVDAANSLLTLAIVRSTTAISPSASATGSASAFGFGNRAKPRARALRFFPFIPFSCPGCASHPRPNPPGSQFLPSTSGQKAPGSLPGMGEGRLQSSRELAARLRGAASSLPGASKPWVGVASRAPGSFRAVPTPPSRGSWEQKWGGWGLPPRLPGAPLSAFDDKRGLPGALPSAFGDAEGAPGRGGAGGGRSCHRGGVASATCLGHF